MLEPIKSQFFQSVLLIKSQFGAISKADSGRMVCNTYIFINSILLLYGNWMQLNTALIPMLWVKVVFLAKNANINKILEALVMKGIFSEIHMCVYLSTKFQVSSIILTSFRQGGNFTPLPLTAKLTPKKPIQIRVKLKP